jgi:hypothetical protein
MALPKPTPPPYDIREWRAKPFAERLEAVCQAWAVQGYGTPWPIYLVYLFKVFFYVGVWCFFCSFTPGIGGFCDISSWWFQPVAFQKAIVWSMAFEGLGLGCGSGPLTGRYLPPVGGFLYFARPGTTKMPLFPGMPLLGGDRRTIFDVLLYLTHYTLLFRALVAPALTPSLLWPFLVSLAILGLTDKTIYLASRSEHFAVMVVCFLFPTDWLAASKIVWVAVWWWAATSKLNRHFPSVVTVMQSNSPLTAFGPFRRWLFRAYPHDLRASKLANAMAHTGTVFEYLFPLALVLSRGGQTTQIALVVMLMFHLFITSSVPMGVPIEWNVVMVYGAFVLFGHDAAVRAWAVSSPILIAFLVVSCLLIQVVGNLVPSRVSFLSSMRYYAGNWGYSIWLFRGDASRKLDSHLVKSAPRVMDQLRKLYDEDTSVALLSKVMAFRAMHLHGRALLTLLPKAVRNIDEYEYLDGEIVAGVVLGWNFGDGHLHDQRLLASVQRQCGFEEGELRCIFVEAQPMLGSSMAYVIADAKTGVIERGEIEVKSLVDLQPWPAKA